MKKVFSLLVALSFFSSYPMEEKKSGTIIAAYPGIIFHSKNELIVLPHGAGLIRRWHEVKAHRTNVKTVSKKVFSGHMNF